MQPPKIGVEDVLKYIAIFKTNKVSTVGTWCFALNDSGSPGGTGCPGSGGFLGVLDHSGFGFPVVFLVVQKTLGIPKLARGFTGFPQKFGL